MEYTTVETITDEQIEDFIRAAGAAGDLDAIPICERALEGDDEATAEVVEWIRYAEELAAEAAKPPLDPRLDDDE